MARVEWQPDLLGLIFQFWAAIETRGPQDGKRGKKTKKDPLETSGIEPEASRMRSERSTPELRPHDEGPGLSIIHKSYQPARSLTCSSHSTGAGTRSSRSVRGRGKIDL